MPLLRKDDISKEMINNRVIKDNVVQVGLDKMLYYTDIKRISKYINISIFDASECCLWTGYITNINNSEKGRYINFYLRRKKYALHRLLFANFKSTLCNNEYIKFSCNNKGICCNVNHMQKYTYTKNKKLTNDYNKNNVNSNNIYDDNNEFVIKKPANNIRRVSSFTIEF
jgi:hypothetical protein